MSGVLLGCDVGGTFTDCVLAAPTEGRLAALKVPTTPEDPARGAAEGMLALLAREGFAPVDVARVVHGSTVATNAVLTRRGPRVALVTNAGFEDLLEIGRQDRPALYDLLADRPAPLVARADRHGVRGRLDARGREVEPLDEAAVRALAPALAPCGAAAVVLLHAYADASHEARVATALAAELPGLPVVTSSATAPEFREYERASTTVVNAFLLPVVDRYLASLERRLAEAGVRAPLLVVDSAGGTATPRAARRRPVTTVLSGPAAGAAGCALVARLAGEPRVLGLDMGGTSTDLCTVVDGAVREAAEGEVAGFPLRVPMLDVVTLGAGGGSLARVDEGGLLKVGPESAEAAPGPACYGRGGAQATVTDAHVALGHLDALLDGAFPLDRAAALRAVGAVAEALGEPVEDAAEAILRVAEASMLAGARLATTARGHDPREFALVAFGGAGPLHAVALARGLGAPRAVVPPHGGVLSALGMLAGPLRRDAVRTWLRDAAGAAAALAELGKEAAAELASDGAPAGALQTRWAADLRYAGQSYELRVPLAAPEAVEGAAAAFHAAHAAAFGWQDAAAAVEVVNLRAVAFAPPPERAAPPRLARSQAPPRPAASRAVRGEAWPVFRRADLRAGDRVEGPALVEDAGSTTLLPQGSAARVDEWGNLVVDPGAGA